MYSCYIYRQHRPENYSTDLLALARSLGEYVIVHELIHLLAPNHGKVFKSFLFAYLPDWEERQQALQQHASFRSELRKMKKPSIHEPK